MKKGSEPENNSGETSQRRGDKSEWEKMSRRQKDSKTFYPKQDEKSYIDFT